MSCSKPTTRESPRNDREYTVFLETSIQIDRLVQTEKRKDTIQRNLLGKDILTSSYVLMEFRRTILQDVCFVHSVVETECEAEANGFVLLSNLERELASGKGSYSPRSAKRSRLVTAAIMDEFPFREAPKSELLEFLNFLMEQLESEFSELSLNDPRMPGLSIRLLNDTNCDLAKGDFRCGASKISCSRLRAKCDLSQFLEAHRDEIIKIRTAFDKAPRRKQDEKMMAAIDQVIASNSWEVALGQRNCWRLGDTIIALQVPQDVPIYTKDRHFDIICPAVEKRTYRETSIQLC